MRGRCQASESVGITYLTRNFKFNGGARPGGQGNREPPSQADSVRGSLRLTQSEPRAAAAAVRPRARLRRLRPTLSGLPVPSATARHGHRIRVPGPTPDSELEARGRRRLGVKFPATQNQPSSEPLRPGLGIRLNPVTKKKIVQHHFCFKPGQTEDFTLVPP